MAQDNKKRAAPPAQGAAARQRVPADQQRQRHLPQYTRLSSPTPAVYLPPRAVPMAAKIRGAASIVAQLAVESPRDSMQAHALAQMAQQLKALAERQVAA